MAAFTKKQNTPLALVFASVSAFAARRRSKGKRGGGSGGRSNKFKGRFQFTDVDEDKIPRLARRKQLQGKEAVAAKAPMAVWMRVVTDCGKTIMMNADQFDAGGARNAVAATPHFS